MYKQDYLQKLDRIVNDSTKFSNVEKGKRKNAKHPLLKRQEEIKETIKEHLKPFISKELCKKLMPRGTNTGKLYGTCKVHKPSNPVRPIVSMVNTPVYELSKYLDNIIKPLIPQKFSLSSNSEFIQQMSKFEHKPGDYCVSFDVASLFTNIPLAETIESVAEKYCATTSKNRPTIPKASLIFLLKCATGGIFSHRKKLFKQTDGVSMGNPLAPTLANFFMGNMEIDVMNRIASKDNNIPKPAMYARYVDDVFCIFRKDENFELFLKELNEYHPNLMFTYEFGGESLPFLDTKITLEPTSFNSAVYRKATDTNVIMNFESVAPEKWKTALAKWFLHRADRVCSNKELLEKEIKHLKIMYKNNGYPDCFLEKILQEHNRKRQETRKTNDLESQDRTTAVNDVEDSHAYTLKIPFIGKPSTTFSRKIKNVLSRVISGKIRVVFTTTKVKDQFRLKDTTEDQLLTKVVYSFKCLRDSGIQYIGYTNRALKVRIDEHLRGGTRVSDHIAQCKACNDGGVNHKNFTILKKCRTKWDTAVYEAILIKRYNPILNKQLVKPGYTHQVQIFN